MLRRAVPGIIQERLYYCPYLARHAAESQASKIQEVESGLLLYGSGFLTA